RPSKWNVLLADDPDPVNGVREQPQAEADEELGHDRQDVHARDQGENAEDDDDANGGQIQGALRQSHRAPEASATASMLAKLFVAISRPFVSDDPRCCSSAFNGTANRPPKKPTSVNIMAAAMAERVQNDRPSADNPMPKAPSGASPSSTLS